MRVLRPLRLMRGRCTLIECPKLAFTEVTEVTEKTSTQRLRDTENKKVDLRVSVSLS